MPTVKDEQGNIVAEMPYDKQGEATAQKMVQDNPGYTVVDARNMREQMYAGGGKTGYNKIGMYEKGGKTQDEWKPKWKKDKDKEMSGDFGYLSKLKKHKELTQKKEAQWEKKSSNEDKRNVAK